jgi:hypothetical protein
MKMTRQHTPGPWIIDSYGDIRDRPGWSLGGRTIAKIRAYDYGWIGTEAQKEQDANTKLIAAAPDLLAALERALNERIGRLGIVDPADDPLCVDLSHVIAQAKGGAE